MIDVTYLALATYVGTWTAMALRDNHSQMRSKNLAEINTNIGRLHGSTKDAITAINDTAAAAKVVAAVSNVVAAAATLAATASASPPPELTPPDLSPPCNETRSLEEEFRILLSEIDAARLETEKARDRIDAARLETERARDKINASLLETEKARDEIEATLSEIDLARAEIDTIWCQYTAPPVDPELPFPTAHLLPLPPRRRAHSNGRGGYMAPTEASKRRANKTG